jgi:hypothetical protein
MGMDGGPARFVSNRVQRCDKDNPNHGARSLRRRADGRMTGNVSLDQRRACGANDLLVLSARLDISCKTTYYG